MYETNAVDAQRPRLHLSRDGFERSRPVSEPPRRRAPLRPLRALRGMRPPLASVPRRAAPFALCLSAVLGAACKDEAASPPAPPPPDTLMERVLDLADSRPAVAARVAAGALSVTSTGSLPGLARRATTWAAASEEPSVVRQVAGALARRGRTRDLERWLTRSSPDGVEVIRAAVISARAEEGNLRFARAGLARISDPERADRARVKVARSLLRKGRLEAAQSVIDSLEDRRLRDEARAELAEAHARAGRWRRALATLAAIGSPFHRAKGEAALARLDYARGRRKKAFDRAKLIESKLVRSELLAELARMAHRAGRRRQARRLFRRARRSAERIDDAFLRGTALAHVASVLAAVGRTRAAESIVEALEPENVAEVRARRVRDLAARGRLAAARRLVDDLDAPGLIASEAEAAVAKLEAKRGELDAALERTADIVLPGVRWRTLGELAGRNETAPVNELRLDAVKRALRGLPTRAR